uniref:Lysozyme n=1 Tax=Ostrinia furnacalis TaxID=93504 RepID=T2C8V4_OSTFU|nr:lysozyme 6 [Ostrinia furnacalis]
MPKLAVVVVFVVAALWSSDAVRLRRCEIVQELRTQGFPEAQMRDWVCLIENESGGNTGKVSPVNKNGSKDYGLFQINDNYWCTRSGPAGKDCHVTCAELTTDDITKAATCAKKIYKRHGFRAWYGWKNHCQGSLPDISNC